MTPLELRHHRTLVALNASMPVLLEMANLVKGFADAQQLRFSELDTIKVMWSFDDRLIFHFDTDTESVFSKKNEEERDQTFERMFSYITRGVERTAVFARVRIDHVRITQAHFAAYDKLVLTYSWLRDAPNA